MEQTNMVMAMFQTMTSTTELPKTGGKTDGESNDFQKLLEEKSQAKDPLVEDRPKASTSNSTKTTVKKTEKDAVQQKEDPIAQVKKMLEQGAWITQPSIGCVDIDLETGETIATYNPGEYILVHMGDGAENTVMIPTVDLEPWQRAQLQQMIDGSGQVIDVSDPKADAMLEATAPGADNSPAALLEQVVDEEAGQVIQQAVEEIQPQQTDDDSEVEITDVEQAPQRVFHDVQAAPVKVGEVYSTEQTDETDVVKQVEDQVAQAIQNGESTVTVKLTPENLGEVTVQINMKDGGIMAVAISARNDDTRALLERHAANLQELLGSRVRQTVEVDVQRQQESQQNQNQQHQNYDGRNGHAQDGQERRRQQREHTNSQDFLQQLRLGLVPTDGEL